MPYITKDKRANIVKQVDKLTNAIQAVGDHPGNVNFAISKLLHYLYFYNDVSYSKINEAIGVLECVKQELYRRVASNYEDEKCQINGDVF